MLKYQPLSLKLISFLVFLIVTNSSIAATVKGLVYLNEERLSHATISLLSDGEEVLTTQADGNGAYEFIDVEAGDYNIKVVADSIDIDKSFVKVEPEISLVNRNIWLIKDEEIDFVEHKGTVSDLNGNVYVGLRLIFASRSDSKRYTATTDSNGQYKLNLPFDSYRVSIKYEGPMPTNSNASIYYYDSGLRTVDFLLKENLILPYL